MTLPLFATFCALAIATLALALRRAMIVRFKGDECLHLLEPDAPTVARQQSAAARLNAVDCWGKGLTILTVLFGIATYVAWWLGA